MVVVPVLINKAAGILNVALPEVTGTETILFIALFAPDKSYSKLTLVKVPNPVMVTGTSCPSQASATVIANAGTTGKGNTSKEPEIVTGPVQVVVLFVILTIEQVVVPAFANKPPGIEKLDVPPVIVITAV